MIPKYENMEFRYLGNSGLKVSVLSFGNWVNNESDQLTEDSVKICLEHGINFFDTAEIYGFGRAETSLGRAFKKLNVPREKIVVSTKIYKISSDPNDSFLSRKHIIEAMKGSLKRLQLDYVDVAFCHRYDMQTPLEETCRAMNFLIDQGLAFYWGTSEWTACQIMEAKTICRQLHLVEPIVEQCQYNLMVRDKMENEYSDLFKKHKMGTTIWSPLFSGVLTGKYINDKPKDSRLATHEGDAKYHNDIYNNNKKEWDEKLLKLKNIAESQLKCTLTQLSIAWVIANTDVSTCILGASKADQLHETIGALKIYKNLDKAIMKEIETILGNAPDGEMDFLAWKRLPNRRNINLGIE